MTQRVFILAGDHIQIVKIDTADRLEIIRDIRIFITDLFIVPVSFKESLIGYRFTKIKALKLGASYLLKETYLFFLFNALAYCADLQ